MKQSRPLKKKKKERTWAEAITEALRRNEKTKIMGLKEIHDAIFLHKLKDIGMTKTDEKNLRTMLAQHTSTPTAAANCSFYRVKDRPGYYGLKDETMLPQLRNVDSPDANSSASSLKRKMKDQDSFGDLGVNAKKKLATKMSTNVARRSNSFAGNALRKARLLTQRRTSSPNVMPSFANLRHRSRLQQVQRSQSTNSLQKSLSNPNMTTSKMQIDLETPSSVLTNTRMKSVINSATFSMLPTSYQYQLIQLLPEVDRKPDEKGVPRMSRTALNNEFFSQAIQDWATQLSEGEFTRETQARIMQEISRERSKINHWKEKFFEEYYGQRKELKRKRSRSHDTGSSIADLSFEAQLSKFTHLATNLDTEADKTEELQSPDVIVLSGSESDQDPDYAGTGQIVPPPPEKDPAKSINRRKISKPFKRTIYNSSVAYPTNTAMIHRRGAVNSSNIFTHFHSNALSKIQVRDETYRSDSEASDAELSDSNSFHQHDETDDDGESSDDMMNAGDNNLLDVDGDHSDSDDSDKPIAELIAKPTYMKTVGRKKSKDEVEPPGKEVQVVDFANKPKEDIVVQTSVNSKVKHDADGIAKSSTGKGVNRESVHKQEKGKSVSVGSSKDPTKAPALETAVKNESVGVLFGHGLQTAVNASYGDSIIPRISSTSALLSSTAPPTTVCTSATPARAIKAKPQLPSPNAKSAPKQEVSKERKTFDAPTGSTFHPLPLTEAVKIKGDVVKRKTSSDDSATKQNVESTSGQSSNTVSKTVRNPPKDEGVTSPFGSSTANLCDAVGQRANISCQPTAIVKSSTGLPGVKRPQTSLNSSPVKRTKTLAEIKAQMKAKRLAVATASPGNSVQKGALLTTPPSQRQPMKLTQPIFCPTSESTPVTISARKLIESSSSCDSKQEIKNVTCDKIASENSSVREPATKISPREVGPANNASDGTTVNKDEEIRDNNHHKEKIILKIKGGVVEKCMTSERNGTVESNTKSSDSDEEIIRKSRRLSHVIMSSGDSSDDLEKLQNSSKDLQKSNENYSMLTQLALPSSFSTKSSSENLPLLKRTPKSPVFGEPPFDVSSIASKNQSSNEISTVTEETIIKGNQQPFMTDKPVIGFQDIPSCSALSSTKDPGLIQPTTTIAPSAESQKYRSTSKGKSLVKMQQLARSNQAHSDESDPLDSDTDSTASPVSSTEDDKQGSAQGIGRSMLRKRDPSTGRVESTSHGLLKPNFNDINGDHSKKKLSNSSDCDDSCSSSSSEEKPIVISECICACKRLVLCKGCGAYTHEECLSASKLCSLCVL